MDNAYIGLVAIPTHMCDVVVQFVEVFLDNLYNIPMKWEPHGPVTDWNECRIVTDPELPLLMKGIAFQLPEDPNPLPNAAIWDKWVDAASPNCPSVLQSMMPALTDKAIVYAFQNSQNVLQVALEVLPNLQQRWLRSLQKALQDVMRLKLLPNLQHEQRRLRWLQKVLKPRAVTKRLVWQTPTVVRVLLTCAQV